MNKIRKLLIPIFIIGMIINLDGCTKNNIGSSCPNFGKYCSKTPINSWNYNN